LEDLFARYLPVVRRIVALRLGKRLSQLVEIDDLVQDALLAVFQGLERFEPRSEGRFRNWVARCVECKLVDSRRRLERKKRGGGRVVRFADCGPDLLRSSIFPGDELTPSRAEMARERDAEIEAALSSLPKHHREVIILSCLCEMSFAEVAEEMGLNSEATARKALSRARKRLEEILER
jgi:RNA polymerase sigma-70 factor (ECF subfamily)